MNNYELMDEKARTVWNDIALFAAKAGCDFTPQLDVFGNVHKECWK